MGTEGKCIGDGGACDRPASSRDMCNSHYLQWLRSTPPEEREPRRRRGLTDLDRFYALVNKMGPVARNNPELGRCHLWTGGKNRGYGVFWAEGTTHRAHVWLYKHKGGVVPADRPHLDHFACDRVDCVNTDHVRPVGERESALRSNNGAAVNAAKETCPEGHDYDESNTRINAAGSRECLKCKRKQQRLMRQAERAIKRDGYVPLSEGSTVCPEGHDLTAKDASRTYHGQLVCLICTEPKGRWPGSKGGGRPPATFVKGKRVA